MVPGMAPAKGFAAADGEGLVGQVRGATGEALRWLDTHWIWLWLSNIDIENGPFIDDFPIETSIYGGFSMAMLDNQMV